MVDTVVTNHPEPIATASAANTSKSGSSTPRKPRVCDGGPEILPDMGTRSISPILVDLARLGHRIGFTSFRGAADVNNQRAGARSFRVAFGRIGVSQPDARTAVDVA